ncbi:MAG: hypothetical protein M3164_07380 [Actinomycetota bacterium]|nr:hypothetical protein [Actinomycetota bacterium]
MDSSSGLRGWFDHLSDHDLKLLARLSPKVGVEPADVLTDPQAVMRVLAHPASFESVFPSSRANTLLPVSPFLTFALVVHRGWADLQVARHVDEWVGPRQRLPVLGGDDLRAFIDGSERRLFLTELLASYTRVTSGSAWVQTSRGWRRRRFSELDPVRLASLLGAVPDDERSGIYRRLGDLALFLTGVFPDHTEMHGLGPLDEARLLRVSGLAEADDELRSSPVSAGGLGILERLGERWYGLAYRTVRGPVSGTTSVLAEVAGSFGVARRTLNYLTDRYLFTRRASWFGDPA